MNSVVTRFAPSPTGLLHIGGVRTALFNLLFTKKESGKLLLRIEDTDKERSTKEYTEDILASFKWLGFDFDGTVIQSERSELHKEYLKKMIDSGHAYVSKEKIDEQGANESETSEYGSKNKAENKRAEVIRFKNPNTTITFHDIIRGNISFDTTELGDFVIAKSLEEPLYHLAVVIDDHEMGITHVIRGEDHISNTPRQILIQQAIGAKMPVYAHLPIILAKDKSKLSKRKHGAAVSVRYYIEKGYLPEALINYMALLGWNPGGEQEIFTLPELVSLFDLSKVQKSGAVFDEEKLKWMNKEHIARMMPKDFLDRIRPTIAAKYPLTEELLLKIAPLILERISIFSELDDMIAVGELDSFFNKPQYEPAILLWKGKGDLKTAAERLTEVATLLKGVNDFTKDTVKEAVWPYAEKIGRGDVLWPLRVSLSGKEKSPDPFTLADILGKTETLARIQEAITKISS